MRLFRRNRPTSDSEAVLARARAEAALEQARAQRPAVTMASESLRHLKDENHFADRVAFLIRGGEG